MVIQNPLVRLTANPISKTGETNRVANLYSRMFDQDWAVIEEYLYELYFDTTGNDLSDEPLTEVTIDPVSGLKSVESRSLLIDFDDWASFQIGVLEEATDVATHSFFEIFIQNAKKIAGGGKKEEFVILLNWHILHDGVTLDPRDFN